MTEFLTFLRWTWAWIILLATIVCLGLGLYYPVLQTEQLFFFTQQHTIPSTIAELYKDDKYFLAAVILIFSVVFPLIKIGALILSLSQIYETHEKRARLVRAVEWLGKWSMADVFIVAIVVFYMQFQSFAKAIEMAGIYYFFISVVLAMYATQRVRALLSRPQQIAA